MNNFKKNMEQIFDVTPTVKEEKVSLPVVSAKYNEADIKQDLNDAYQQSKENLQGIIDQGKDAMEEILNIAKAGQHPRAFEVYSGLLKNMTEANDRLLKIQKEMPSSTAFYNHSLEFKIETKEKTENKIGNLLFAALTL